MKTNRIIRAGACLLLALLSGACGELTSGGVGEVEVWTTADDPQSGAATTPPAPSRSVVAVPGEASPAPSPAKSSSASADGTLSAQLQAYLRSEVTGEWIEITEGVRDITLDLNGASERRAGVRFLASGRYTGFRVVFQRVEANVTAGLVVGGVPVLGTVRVDLGAQGLIVERDLVLEVEARGARDVLLDLGADLWLPRLSLATRTVAAADLRSAVAIRVR
jgi:hypothetical protein